MSRPVRRGRHTEHTICSARSFDSHARETYGSLFDELVLLLFIADPMGINFHRNVDEYHHEVEMILPRLDACASATDLAAILVDVFDRQFHPGSVSLEKAMPIAEVAFRASCRHGITRWPGWENRTCLIADA